MFKLKKERLELTRASIRRRDLQNKLLHHSLDVIQDHSLPILFCPHTLDLRIEPLPPVMICIWSTLFVLGGTCGWRDNILLHGSTYMMVRSIGSTPILRCAIWRGGVRLINPIIWNTNSYLSWIWQVKNGLVSDHDHIGVPHKSYLGE